MLGGAKVEGWLLVVKLVSDSAAEYRIVYTKNWNITYHTVSLVQAYNEGSLVTLFLCILKEEYTSLHCIYPQILCSVIPCTMRWANWVCKLSSLSQCQAIHGVVHESVTWQLHESVMLKLLNTIKMPTKQQLLTKQQKNKRNQPITKRSTFQASCS